MTRQNSLFVGNHVNAWIVKSGGLGKEWSNYSHGGRDGHRIAKRCPKTHHGVRRPGNQEHDNHYNGHLSTANITQHLFNIGRIL